MAQAAPAQYKARSPTMQLMGPSGNLFNTSDLTDYRDGYIDLAAGADIGMFYDKAQWDKDRYQQDQYRKNKMLNRLWPEYENMGSGSMKFTSPAIPAPNYVSAGPVWTQGQIDAQAGLQRGNLVSQATNESQQFNRNLASRGFSPLSPIGMLNQQNNIMRANAAAASNETGLNFDAAKANSDARLRAQQINAGMYGDYSRSIANQRQGEMDFYNKQQQMKNQFLMQLFGAV